MASTIRHFSDELATQTPSFSFDGEPGRLELVVATNPGLTNAVITRKDDNRLPSNAWQSDVTLEYETAYFWKVRAVNGSTKSAWSAIGSFTTESEFVETGMVAEVPFTPTTETSESNQFQPATTQEADSQQSPPLPPAQPPNAVSSSAMPDWAIYLIASQVVMIALALVVILVLVSRARRSR